LPPELKIIFYIIFVIAIFLIQNLPVYILMLAVILIFLFRIPFTSIKSGWLPITFFLVFTFISNMFFNHGKIVYSLGSVVITEEGLHAATIRTMRVFFMIAGAKIITASTPLEDLIGALAKTLRPLEKTGLPVAEFFSTMGLTLRCFPKLKDYLTENYRNHRDKGNLRGFSGKAKIISSFLLPLFIQSMKSPEIFFNEKN